MFSKKTQRIVMGLICFFTAITMVGILEFVKITLDSKIYTVPLKGLLFIALLYIGYYLVYNKDLI